MWQPCGSRVHVAAPLPQAQALPASATPVRQLLSPAAGVGPSPSAASSSFPVRRVAGEAVTPITPVAPAAWSSGAQSPGNLTARTPVASSNGGPSPRSCGPWITAPSEARSSGSVPRAAVAQAAPVQNIPMPVATVACGGASCIVKRSGWVLPETSSADGGVSRLAVASAAIAAARSSTASEGSRSTAPDASVPSHLADVAREENVFTPVGTRTLGPDALSEEQSIAATSTDKDLSQDPHPGVLPGEAHEAPPAPEEVPPWRSWRLPAKQMPAPEPPSEAAEEEDSADCSQKDIGWTPSFHSLAQLRPQQLGSPGAEAEAKNARISMAPTVHEAVCEEEDALAFATAVVQGVEAAAAAAVGGMPLADKVPLWAANASLSQRNFGRSFANFFSRETQSPRRQSLPRRHSESEASVVSSGSTANPAREEEVPEDIRKEIAELRNSVTKETSERAQIQALYNRTSERLLECEEQVAGLSRDLKDFKAERDELRQKLQEKAERHLELTRKLRKQQEANRSMESDLSMMQAARHQLESKVREDHDALTSAETLVGELRGRLASLQSSVQERDSSSCDSEAQLQQLRDQFETTIRALHSRTSSSKEAETVAAQPTAPVGEGNDAGDIGAVSAPADPSDLDEEAELPTAGGLLREWASVYKATEEDVLCVSPAAGSGSAAQSRPPTRAAMTLRSPPSKSSRGGISPMESPGLANEASPPARLPDPRIPDASPASASKSLMSPSPKASTRDGHGISMRDLCEIKALKKPPPPIRMLMEVCCLLFHIQPVKQPDEKSIQGRLRVDYWEPARRYLLSDPFLLSKLRSYDEEIAPSQRAKINKYFKDPEFSSERVLNCSKAAYELYACVSALMGLEEAAALPSAAAERGAAST
eukprot:TRINITY_DN25818_c0_g1_i2.p1 TRINITY_DN25818_c0_g1~~TRINITY_DN25818_c0_g1_i2.p1  ORF type:complete len:882 (-),score=177.30 TRINITY_DN25818_c0_g1_i2:87-2732(-)